jgi:hypothetical protein
VDVRFILDGRVKDYEATDLADLMRRDACRAEERHCRFVSY